MPTKHITANSPLTDFNDPNTIFIIEDPLNLRPIQEQDSLIITLGAYSVLTFTDDGAILNGTIEGNYSSIDYVGQENHLSNVTLKGIWVGPICDLIFAYDTSQAVKPAFNDILKSLLCFQKIDLRRSEYFIQWGSVNPDYSVTVPATNNPEEQGEQGESGEPGGLAEQPPVILHDVVIDGHGAKFYLAADKGTATVGDSGAAYDIPSLMSVFNEDIQRNCFVLKNLTIEDNAATSPYTGYGEANVDSQHIVYSIFEGLASCRTEFRNVKYDGGGVFLKCHNDSLSANLLLFKDCDLHTNGHAVEIACKIQAGDMGSGSLTEAVFDHSILLNHFSRFAGVLSFTGAGLTKRLKIINSRVGGYRGNLVVSGVEQVLVNKTTLVNHGLCSEVRMEAGMTYPTVCHCTDSQILLSESPGWEGSFRIMGRNVLLMNNRLACHGELVFSHIERLFFHNNRIEVPSLTSHVIDTDSTVGIGYYGNNMLFSPWINDGPYSFRLNTAAVLAQYEPFRSMFRNAPCEEIDCTSFNWSNGMLPATLLNDGDLSFDQNGYAWNDMEMVCLNTQPIQDTVTISLIGRPFPPPSGFSEPEMVFCEIGDMIPLTITNTAQSVYRVYLWGRLIADITRASFSPNAEDVRLDVTITQINGHLDTFVFVNQEVFAKDRSNALEQYSPTSLTFTPNLFTGIRAIRFVPGGFILDEPDSLMTDLLDE